MGLFGTAASIFSDLSLILEVIILSVFVIGFTYARRHLSNRHYKLMTVGFLINLFFVVFFMIGRRTVAASPEFVGPESIRRIVYLPIVIIHGITSILALILAGYAVNFGYRHTITKKKKVFQNRNDYKIHKKIGYTTLIVWSIAFLTDVLVYLLLYVLYI